MSATSPAVPDLTALEQDEEFRAHFLFFLGLANTYIVSIFWHCFNDSKRRRKLYAAVNQLNAEQEEQPRRKEINRKDLLQDRFRQALYAERQFDAYSASFQTLMEALPDTRKTAFKGKLTEHAIPLDLKAFLDLVDELRLRRHHLQHWKPDANRRFNEGKVLRALGLLLPSKQHQHFIGAMQHAAKRLSRSKAEAAIDTRAVDTVFRKARKDRSEATFAYYGKRRKKSELSRAERKNRENSMTAVQAKYTAFYPDGSWPRYNFHLFKIRYYFFGRNNIKKIMNLLNTDTPHFQRDIEAVFETATHIGRVLHLAIFRLEQADKSLTKKQRRDGMAAVQGRMRDVRNAIAHNTLFFSIEARVAEGDNNSSKVLLTPKDVFKIVFEAFFTPHVIAKLGPAREQVNDIYSKILGLLNKQKYHWAFPVQQAAAENESIDHTPPKVIRHWSEANRKEYGNRNKWRLDARGEVKKIMAGWATALEAGREKAYAAQQEPGTKTESG